MKYLKLFSVCLACLFSTGGLAKRIVADEPDEKPESGSRANQATVITLGKHRISRDNFNWLYTKYVPRQTHTKREFAEQLVDNWLLFQHTLEITPKALQISPVDYTLEWYLERHLVNYCQHELHEKGKKQQSRSSASFDKLDEVQLKKLVTNFELRSKLGFELTSAQRSQLAKISVAQFDETTIKVNTDQETPFQQLSLSSLFDRLSIQDKQRLFDGDFNLIKREVGIWLSYREYCSQVSQNELTVMRSILESLHFRHQLLDHYAISLEQHGDNKALDRYRSQVTSEAVKKYYQINKKHFQYLKSSLYSVYQFSSVEEADSFRQNFSVGDAEPVARWINKDSELNSIQSWLSNFAFSLPIEHLSNSIRSPEGDWFVVYVFDKKFDYYSAESETVNYQATNFLAKKYAKKFFVALLKKLRESNQVDINV